MFLFRLFVPTVRIPQVAQGVHHITFGDPDFFNGPTHAMRITRAMHQEFPGVTFDATIKIEHLLPELRKLGCAFIVSAVESINDDVFRHLNKGHTGANVAEVFDLMDQVGIPLRPSLLPFSPWETLESYIALLHFFEERRLVEHVDPVHFSIRLLVPLVPRCSMHPIPRTGLESLMPPLTPIAGRIPTRVWMTCSVRWQRW
jgi:hypothetical protein